MELKKIEMVAIKGGTFMMGSNEWSDEKPIHKVTVKDFCIGKYPVTQKQWYEIMEHNPSHFKGCDECPVEKVSWQDVQFFITLLNQKTGQKYRLPTEAEWEYAAKGGKDYKYAGSDSIDDVAWYTLNSNKTNPVGLKLPNDYGLYDMSGNVLEWCQDVWHENYNGAPQNGTARTLGGCRSCRVLRGGSWRLASNSCYTTFRFKTYDVYRANNVGFRLAHD